MLSFYEYIHENKIAHLKRQVISRLSASGMTLEEVMKEILHGEKIQNEFFGGFINRLGNAWRGFWHGDTNSEKKYTTAQVRDYVVNATQPLKDQIEDLMTKIKKQGGNKDVVAALYEIMKKTSGRYQNVINTINAVDGANDKKGGIMERFRAATTSLHDLSQNSNHTPEERLSGIDQLQKNFAAIEKDAQTASQSTIDATDAQEGKTVIQRLEDSNFKLLLQSIEDIKDEIQKHVKKNDDFDDSITDITKNRNGFDSKAYKLPEDLKQVYQELKKMNQPDRIASLDLWWRSMSPDKKQNTFDQLPINKNLKLDKVTGSTLLRSFASLYGNF